MLIFLAFLLMLYGCLSNQSGVSKNRSHFVEAIGLIEISGILLASLQMHWFGLNPFLNNVNDECMGFSPRNQLYPVGFSDHDFKHNFFFLTPII